MSPIIYDGVCLNDMFQIAGVSFPFLPGIDIDAKSVPGLAGEARVGRQLEPIDIKVKLRLDAQSRCPVDIKAKWAEMAPVFFKDGPRPLSLGNGVYYLAEVAGATEIDDRAYYGEVTVTFHCSDPIAYGAERTIEVPSGGSVTFAVGGSYPTRPVIAAPEAVRDQSSLLWGLNLDAGDYLRVATGSASARRVRLDCAKRTCEIAGTVALPTMESDWFSFEPGEHTVRNDQGSGACTMTYVERWIA